VRLHWRRAPGAATQVLCGAVKPILELPSSMRVCDGQPGCARQAQTGVQGGGLPDATRQAEGNPGGREILEAEHQPEGLGAAGDADERHRVCLQNDSSQNQIAARMQDGITGAAASVSVKAPGEGRGNDGTVESVGNQKQVSPSSPRPLEISQGRDSHIPTARHRPAGEGGKTNSGFPHSPAKRATTNAALSFKHPKQTLERSARKTGERPRSAGSPLPFRYHLALETKGDFS